MASVETSIRFLPDIIGCAHVLEQQFEQHHLDGQEDIDGDVAGQR